MDNDAVPLPGGIGSGRHPQPTLTKSYARSFTPRDPPGSNVSPLISRATARFVLSVRGFGRRVRWSCRPRTAAAGGRPQGRP
jgi:hypothetical protein